MHSLAAALRYCVQGSALSLSCCCRWGLLGGLANAALTTYITRGKEPWTLKHRCVASSCSAMGFGCCYSVLCMVDCVACLKAPLAFKYASCMRAVAVTLPGPGLTRNGVGQHA